MIRHRLSSFAVILALVGWALPAQESELPAFNQLVLEIAETYPSDGTHDYWWPRGGEGGGFDGCSQDMFLAGVKVMDGEPQGRTFCCGLTLEVFLRAYNQWIEESGIEPDHALATEDWSQFQRLWFVMETNGPGPSAALEEFGLGRTITPDETLPGDFVQIWRHTGSGHSVVFKEWIRDETGAITGLRYWSTQPGTSGISENTEEVNPPGSESGITLEHTHIGRVDIPPPVMSEPMDGDAAT
jgi:hypothetical protein